MELGWTVLEEQAHTTEKEIENEGRDTASRNEQKYIKYAHMLYAYTNTVSRPQTHESAAIHTEICPSLLSLLPPGLN